jgi:WD40-like Beta Propeller Repeat
MNWGASTGQRPSAFFIPQNLFPPAYVVPVSGGEWARITEGRYRDDFPRWSPAGMTIYFISRRAGFYHVWGIHFNPATEKPVGEPFRVTSFESLSHMIRPGLGVAVNRLVITLQEISENIWTLENVDR